ncbi:MAG: peroxiredoxin [Chloroflexia bacterium]
MPSIGEIAPDFEMLDDAGNRVKLSDFRGKKVVLYFYPADFTSGCELQACKFRDAYPQIEEGNAVVLGVSPDGVDSHKKFKEAHNLPFTLLVDSDRSLAKAWGNTSTVTREDGSEATRYLRGQYIIDEDGRIIAAQSPVQAPQSLRLALEGLGLGPESA